jgi:hypothetical protein
MSGAHVAATAGAGAAIAAGAAAVAARMREEEEKLTTYNKDDMDGWEFKIVRANTRYFRKPVNLQKTCEEEAKAGWEMVEKFDNARVRFKRRVDKRQNDQFLQGIDPYRTQVGIGNAQLGFTIGGIVALSIAVLLAVVFFVKSMD